MNKHDKGWMASQQEAAGLPGKPMAALLAIVFVIGFAGLLMVAGYTGEFLGNVVGYLF